MLRTVALASAFGLLVACSDPNTDAATSPMGDAPAAPGDPEFGCSIPPSLIQDGGPGKDGIPALVNPPLVAVGDSLTSYLRDDDRVMGIEVGGEVVAVPLNVLWWHEIANVDLATTKLAVTHCPLTGSSLTFRRDAIGGAEFGVSGLLFLNNLMMYDRTSGESLWPQMLREARCGPRDATPLEMVPTIEMTWSRWRTLHPETKVVPSTTGFNRDYRIYPYGNYAEPSNSALLVPIPGGIDPRRPPKERVLGIPSGEAGGVAFPFGSLDATGPLAVVAATAQGRGAVVFWERLGQAAVAYFTTTPQGELSFSVDGGFIVDGNTGSTWRIDGVATSGPLTGTRLRPVSTAFVAYWFAWAVFYPESLLWEGF